jgi:hypothetical protein
LSLVAFDQLGVGDSSRLVGDASCGLAEQAAAADAAVEFIREQLRNGALVDGLPPVDSPVLVGVGHSMGAALAAVQQSRFGSYDRTCLPGLNQITWDVAMTERIGGPAASDEEIHAATERFVATLYESDAWSGPGTYATFALMPLQPGSGSPD